MSWVLLGGFSPLIGRNGIRGERGERGREIVYGRMRVMI